MGIQTSLGGVSEIRCSFCGECMRILQNRPDTIHDWVSWTPPILHVQVRTPFLGKLVYTNIYIYIWAEVCPCDLRRGRGLPLISLYLYIYIWYYMEGFSIRVVRSLLWVKRITHSCPAETLSMKLNLQLKLQWLHSPLITTAHYHYGLLDLKGTLIYPK